MDDSLLTRLKEELLACEGLPPSEREARLAELGRTAPDMERELRSLLHQAPIPEPGLTGAGLEVDAILPGLRGSDAALRQLGPYRLIDVLGVGGMGIVYRAEQKEPIQREVAVKLLRGGLDAERILARFEAERRAMALLEHPAIARVLDAGSDVDGMPYLVTELVRGSPISDYCREHELTVPRILRLFVDVCRAVQHAHQKGIIHRDLKPSNILVAEVDGAPRPKIIDFGVARILEEEGEAAPTLTIEGQAVGTLGYMSPEQAAGSRATDTRADVYSLGTVLYELLAGGLPHALEGLGVAEALAVIAREPPRTLRTLAGKTRRVDGDLETIVMKALAHEPRARCEGAGAFADDLERYLRHEAIVARPPSTTYVLKKLVRRHRAAFAVGSIALVIVAGVAIAMSVLYASQRREWRRAESEARKARATNAFLQDMLGSASPSVKHVDVTVREVLDDAARRLDFGGIEDPEVETALRRTIGSTYLELGEFRKAGQQLTRALELGRRTLGDHPLVAECLGDLIDLQIALGPDPAGFARADSMCREEIRIRRRVFGEQRHEYARSVHEWSRIKLRRNELAAAESLERRAIAILEESPVQDSRGLYWSYGNMGDILVARNRPAEAESFYRRSVDVLRVDHPKDHPEVVDALSTLAWFLARSNRSLSEADSLMVKVLATERRLWANRHMRVARALGRLGWIRIEEGRMAEAESLYDESFRMQIRIHGEGTLGAAQANSEHAYGLFRCRRYDRALPSYETAVSIWKDHHVESIDCAYAMHNLAASRRLCGDRRDPIPLQLEALQMMERVTGPTSIQVGDMCEDIGQTLLQMNQPAKAESYLRRSIDISKRAYGHRDRRVASGLTGLGFLLHRLDRLPEAEAQYRRSLAAYTTSLGTEWDFDRVNTLANLGICVYHEGRLPEAEELFREADRHWRESVGADHFQYAWMLVQFGSVLLDRGELDESDSLLTRSLEIMRATKGFARAWISWNENALGSVAAVRGRSAEADSMFRRSEALADLRRRLPPGTQRIADGRYARYRAAHPRASAGTAIGLP